MNIQASDLTHTRLEHIVDENGLHDIVLVSARLLKGRLLTGLEIAEVNNNETVMLDLIGTANVVGGVV